MSRFVRPPADFYNAGVEAFVDVYPLTGGSFTLTGSNAQIISLHTQKYIRGQSSPGTFSIQLAPGGPKGVNDPTSWTSIITQFSLCVIYIRRGSSNQVVMVGVVDTISERQSWEKDSVSRIINIAGYDFSVYLMNFAYYVMTYLGLISTLPEVGGPAGTAILTTGGTVVGTPNVAADNWFTNVFLGAPSGPPSSSATAAALNSTYLRYRGNRYFLNQMWSSIFEPYLVGGDPTFIFIPFLSDFMQAQGNFWSKFADILPWPFYEMFVNTVPAGYYSDLLTVPSVVFEPQVSGFSPAEVVMIGRVNPLPWVELQYPNPNTSTPKWISDKWDNLDIFYLDPISFKDSSVVYSSEDLSNFYVIDPMGIVTATGTTSSNIEAAIIQMGCMFDQNSINRYGFRPQVVSTKWWLDPVGITAKIAAGSAATSKQYPGAAQFISFLSRQASIYEPLPNMLRGEVTFPMWPDPIVGNKFVYVPFKNNDHYTFYITGVQHDWVFGGPSITKLILERGLKSTDYDDIADTMIPLHQGLIDRIDGQLVPRSDSGRGLTYLDPKGDPNLVTEGAFFLANGTGPSGGF